MPLKYKQLQLKLMLGYKFHKFLCPWGDHRALDVPWESLEINVDGVKVPICFQQPTPPQMLLDPHGVRLKRTAQQVET